MRPYAILTFLPLCLGLHPGGFHGMDLQQQRPPPRQSPLEEGKDLAAYAKAVAAG